MNKLECLIGNTLLVQFATDVAISLREKLRLKGKKMNAQLHSVTLTVNPFIYSEARKTVMEKAYQSWIICCSLGDELCASMLSRTKRVGRQFTFSKVP